MAFGGRVMSILGLWSSWYDAPDLDDEELDPEPWPNEVLFVSAGAVSWSLVDDDPEMVS